jgi:hypothetical protein
LHHRDNGIPIPVGAAQKLPAKGYQNVTKQNRQFLSALIGNNGIPISQSGQTKITANVFLRD